MPLTLTPPNMFGPGNFKVPGTQTISAYLRQRQQYRQQHQIYSSQSIIHQYILSSQSTKKDDDTG